MTHYTDEAIALVERAKTATVQELRQDYVGGKQVWHLATRMPSRNYWHDVYRMLQEEPENIVIEEQNGCVFIDRITKEGRHLGRIGGKEKYAQEDLHDARMFSSFEEE